jgi:hypothetical protein
MRVDSGLVFWWQRQCAEMLDDPLLVAVEINSVG